MTRWGGGGALLRAISPLWPGAVMALSAPKVDAKRICAVLG